MFLSTLRTYTNDNYYFCFPTAQLIVFYKPLVTMNNIWLTICSQCYTEDPKSYILGYIKFIRYLYPIIYYTYAIYYGNGHKFSELANTKLNRLRFVRADASVYFIILLELADGVPTFLAHNVIEVDKTFCSYKMSQTHLF